MSKKNLARSIIEGGRVSYSKYERRNSHSAERAAARAFCQKVSLDPDYADEAAIEPREMAWKDSVSKLGPMRRWLDNQVGRLWDDVFSDISQKFNIRNSSGRSLIYDYLLHWVELYPDVRYPEKDRTVSNYPHTYYVDDNGFFRKKRYVIPSWKLKQLQYTKQPKCDTGALANWLNGRVPGRVGNKWFWFVPVTKNKKYFGYSYQWKTEWGAYRDFWKYDVGLKFLYLANVPIYAKDKEGNKVVLEYKPTWCQSSPRSFRQDVPLSKTDIVFWENIPQFYQKKVLEFSPMTKCA